QSAQAELEAGKSSLEEANTKHDATLAADAGTHFTAAKGQFTAAAQIADSSSLLQWLERTPEVSASIRSKHLAVDGIAAMGVAIAEAGQELAALDGQLIKPPATGPAGHTLLTVLDTARVSIVKVKDDLSRAQKAAASVDLKVVPAGQQATFQ